MTAPAVFAPLKAHKPPSLLPFAATLAFVALTSNLGWALR